MRRSLWTAVTSALLAMPFVSAAPSAANVNLGGFVQTFVNLFSSAFNFQVTAANVVPFTRGLIFVLILTASYFAAKTYVFKNSPLKYTSLLFALVMAAFTFLIPTNLINEIATVYSTIFYLGIILLVLIGAIALAFFRDNTRPRDHMVGFLALLLAYGVLWALRSGATASLIRGGATADLAGIVLSVVYTILIPILLLVKLFQMMGGPDSTHNGESWISRHGGRLGRGLSNWWNGTHTPPPPGGTTPPGATPPGAAGPAGGPPPPGAAVGPRDCDAHLAAADAAITGAQGTLDTAAAALETIRAYDRATDTATAVNAVGNTAVDTIDDNLERAVDTHLSDAMNHLYAIINDPNLQYITPTQLTRLRTYWAHASTLNRYANRLLWVRLNAVTA